MADLASAPQRIPPGWKFAAIGLDTNRLASNLPDVVNLADDVWACRQPPFDVPAHWKGWLGSLRLEAVRAADLWIVSRAPTDQPDVADATTAALDAAIHETYHAFMISADHIAHGPAIRLSGSNSGAGARVRGAQEYPRAVHVRFGPRVDVTAETFATTMKVLKGLRELKQKDRFRRVWRIIRSFDAAVRHSELDERIHQHVRCIEGFIFPRKGSTKEDFVDRSCVFLDDSPDSLLGELFDIRSAVEHLHGPFRFLPAVAKRDRHVRLLRRGIEAEGLARHAVRRFLSTPILWPYYADDQTLEQFWNHLSRDEQIRAWGPRIRFSEIAEDFDEDWITDRDLDLT